ncbi:MAG: hypothetical protein ACYTFK_05090 [Planctomycetota bacterium]|jgi:hypothetical protein
MSDNIFSIKIEDTKNRCPIGETVGERNIAENKIPVLSCEGACIRGMVAKEEPFARVCHGELLSVPDSAMARWVNLSKKVVLIDGCFIRCHGRILEDLVGKEKLVQFDALSHHKKYCDKFDVDSVPENERKQVARDVADWVLGNLKEGVTNACSS